VNAACKLALAKTTDVDNSARRNQLITEHLPLVRTIALSIWRSVPPHVELDDLIHAGTMGLFDAATKYCEEKQTAFRTYAQYRIRGAILDSLRSADCASRDLRRRYKKVQMTVQELAASFGRTPCESEIAEALGIDCTQLRIWNVEFRRLAPAQSRTGEEANPVETEIPASPAQSPDGIFARQEMQRKLKLAMISLPVRHREVVELYYEGDRTMREIGEILGVNESRISQIHKSALCRMQKTLRESGVTSSLAFC
jgi:RNA polymerase sigma factor FliA